MARRYFNKVYFDKQGRICLGKDLIEAGTKVFVYTTDADSDIVHVRRCTGEEKNVPAYAIRTLDSKSRLIMMSGLRRNAIMACVGMDDNGEIALKLIYK